jgi:N-acyl-D-amino-acid deacylase
MTSFPAGLLGIDDRGILKNGMKADIIVFDPRNVRALATYPEPLQFAEGFNAVIVNGRIARQDSRFRDARNGRVLVPVDAAANGVDG